MPYQFAFRIGGSEAVGEVVLVNHLRVGRIQHLGAALLPDVLAVVADQPVPLARHARLDEAGRSDLKALFGA